MSFINNINRLNNSSLQHSASDPIEKKEPNSDSQTKTAQFNPLRKRAVSTNSTPQGSFLQRFSVLTPEVEMNNALPVFDMKTIKLWLSSPVPKHIAHNIAEAIVAYPTKEEELLEAFEDEFKSKIKNNSEDKFFELLLQVMTYNHVRPQHLITKFYNNRFEKACRRSCEPEPSLKPSKTLGFIRLKPESKKKQDNIYKDPIKLTDNLKSRFAEQVLVHFERSENLLPLLCAILEADIQDEKEETVLRGQFLSTRLAHLGFQTYLKPILEQTRTDLANFATEALPEKLMPQLISCAITLLNKLKEQEFIKVISISVNEKVSEKFLNNKRILIRRILTNLLFLRTICPHFVLLNTPQGQYFGKLLNAIANSSPEVMSEILLQTMEGSESPEEQKRIIEQNTIDSQKNKEINLLNVAYQKHYFQLNQLVEELLFPSYEKPE